MGSESLSAIGHINEREPSRARPGALQLPSPVPRYHMIGGGVGEDHRSVSQKGGIYRVGADQLHTVARGGRRLIEARAPLGPLLNLTATCLL